MTSTIVKKQNIYNCDTDNNSVLQACLLMSTLYRAVTLIEVYNITITITDDLNFNMSRSFNELL